MWSRRKGKGEKEKADRAKGGRYFLVLGVGDWSHRGVSLLSFVFLFGFLFTQIVAGLIWVETKIERTFFENC